MADEHARTPMRCDNCRAHGEMAFTLAAYPDDGDDPVFVDFCSSDCLQEWTTADGGDFGRWRWGADGETPERAHASTAD